MVSTLRTGADLVKGLLAGTWHSGCTEETLTFHAFSLTDLIICIPNSSTASYTQSLPARPERPSNDFTWQCWSSTISQQPRPKHTCSVSHFCKALLLLLGYKGRKFVDPINKSLLTQYLAEEVPSQVTSHHNPIKTPRVTETCKNCEPLASMGSSTAGQSLVNSQQMNCYQLHSWIQLACN